MLTTIANTGRYLTVGDHDRIMKQVFKCKTIELANDVSE